MPESDLTNAKELLHHHEFGLGLDTIVTQLYDYNIEIDRETYELIERIAHDLHLPTESYSFLKELITDNGSS
ncbi:MafI family immunity protein [Niastella vici]|uniref:MafI family immunity protein n=1 Tax=Niastella vici TaxID=1703345 RepID=UPI001301A9D7